MDAGERPTDLGSNPSACGATPSVLVAGVILLKEWSLLGEGNVENSDLYSMALIFPSPCDK
jgi:hypothetical protein